MHSPFVAVLPVTLNRPPSEKPQSPSVVGFDLPTSEGAGGTQGHQILSAQLDGAPSPIWLATFASLVERFKLENGVEDVRVVGTSLNVVGARGQLRTIPGALRLLVESVADQVVRNRVNNRMPRQVPAIDPLAHWVDQELLSAVPRVVEILQWLHRESNMRFTAVARVTDLTWTALAFYDTMNFGMSPFHQLVLEDTICNEIRQHRKTVFFGKASTDPLYMGHHVPSLYGFESYISIPIVTPEGIFFGTLCALDKEPKSLAEDIVRRAEAEASWIGTQVGGLLRKIEE